MESLKRFVDKYRDVCMDGVRIYLGFGLLAKGIFFLGQTEYLAEMLHGGGWGANSILIHYIGLAHVTGGAMMIIGMSTRLAALIQIPILFGAVFFIHFKEGVFTSGQNLEFSALVLFLLVMLAIHGSGPWSLDARLEKKAG